MSNRKKNDNRNASSSWSGYNHQGKVGIFLGLKHLLEVINNDEDFSDYLLEFEGAEDVDIKKGEVIISRHQIKAKQKATTPKAYKDVLSVYPNSEGKGFNIQGVNENSRYLHTICEVKGIVSSITEFEKLKEEKEIDSRTIFVENKSNIQLYKYPNKNKFCDLSKGYHDTIECYSRNKIRKILEKQNHKMSKDETFIENKLNDIKELLTERIREAHINGGEETPRLWLKEIHNEVISDREVRDQAIYIAKSYFEIYWNKFIEKNDIDKLTDKILSQILNMKADDFESFIKDLNPAKTIEHIGPDSLIDETALEEIFFMFLNGVDNNYVELEDLLCKTDSTYRLSLINNKPGNVGSVVDSIIANESMLKRAFDSDYLVNGSIDKIRVINDEVDGLLNESIHENNYEYLPLPKNNIFKTSLEFICIERAINIVEDELNAQNITSNL